jgi:hypothetical protein
LNSCRTGELGFHHGLLVGRRDGYILLEATMSLSKISGEAMRTLSLRLASISRSTE